ncbi:hypothetical protein PoB_007154700 [Plakobranchus ocellatus]|uniref:Uncharacterized protein n=1 Tax=Plakobranchus ocellatus TaxID=259542 RepID=A0AAV4DL86_9GAST|nr:hypothetical protein PoB_007154700 [Plakobranchus ocellatus]
MSGRTRSGRCESSVLIQPPQRRAIDLVSQNWQGSLLCRARVGTATPPTEGSYAGHWKKGFGSSRQHFHLDRMMGRQIIVANTGQKLLERGADQNASKIVHGSFQRIRAIRCVYALSQSEAKNASEVNS